jgi:beta-lactamase class A
MNLANTPSRRTVLLALASTVLMSACTTTIQPQATSTSTRLSALEKQALGRLGIFALNMANGTSVSHRAHERFPFASTFKAILAAAILNHSTHETGFLQKRIQYTKTELVTYSPITAQYIAQGMTVAELCAAMVQYSDNTAANLLMKLLGGPSAVTAYARSIGDGKFRLDRWEPELNTAIPGDPQDTSTPYAMAHSLQRLVLGNALTRPARDQLQRWLLGNTTGNTKIRAAVPSNWQVCDKTGSGDYGTTNDIAVIWPPTRPPVVVAIYFTQNTPHAQRQDTIVASATRIILEEFGLN